uniref:Uncharacterized protein n=1 Tax=Salix viminalis TaxID=40686 RepID=A0A6N2MU33_SALVM
MAGILLSGADIAYNGNPLDDLSPPAFLDKFMEKKPEQTASHGDGNFNCLGFGWRRKLPDKHS